MGTTAESSGTKWWRDLDGIPPSWEQNRHRLWWVPLAALAIFPLMALLLWSQGYGFGGWALGVNAGWATVVAITVARRERRR